METLTTTTQESPKKYLIKRILWGMAASVVLLLILAAVNAAFANTIKEQRTDALRVYQQAEKELQEKKLNLCHKEKLLAGASLADHGNGLFKLAPDQAKSLTWKRDEMKCDDSFIPAAQ